MLCVAAASLTDSTIKACAESNVGENCHVLRVGVGIAIIIGFQRSANLTATYGLTVAYDMFQTSVLFCFVLRVIWRWPVALIICMAPVMFRWDS